MNGEKYNINPYYQLQNKIRNRKPRLDYNLNSPDEALAWRNEARRTLYSILRFDKLKEINKSIPELVILETYHEDGYDRLDIRIRTEDDMWVPAFLLLPWDGKKKHPLAMCFHGHGMNRYITAGCPRNTDDSNIISAYRGDYGKKLAKEGFAVFAPTARGFDERGDAGCGELHFAYSLEGLSLSGLRLWDHSRSLDALICREDIDPSAVITAGLSMGCEQAMFLAALEERVKGVIASCNVFDIREMVYRNRFSYCPCSYLDGLFAEFNWPDIVSAIAPRLLVIEHGEHDTDNYPEEVILSAIKKVSEAYEVEGKPDNLLFYWHEGGHQFFGDKGIRFIKERLLV